MRFTRRYLQLIFTEDRGNDVLALVGEPHERVFFQYFRCRLLKCLNHIQAMRCGKDLYPRCRCEPEYPAPGIELHAVAHTVLELADRQQLIFGVDEGKGDPEESTQPVTKGSYRDARLQYADISIDRLLPSIRRTLMDR